MADLEAFASELEASGDYRVLRRLRDEDRIADGIEPGETKIGIILDTETTGLDPAKDEVIELGMVKFEFTAYGRVRRVLDRFSGLRQPSAPIPPAITKLTGLTDEMVEGKAIDPEAVAAFAAPAVVVIAHNAAFDRGFAERAWSVFKDKAWACSATEIGWQEEGVESAKLGWLLAHCGLFHDAHRATDDCLALLAVLARPLPSGELALKRLLDRARKASYRIWAVDSPFGRKDDLKARGYRWSDGSAGRKAWWTDVSEEGFEDEIAWLTAEIYGRQVDLPIARLTAFERFSERAA